MISWQICDDKKRERHALGSRDLTNAAKSLNYSHPHRLGSVRRGMNGFSNHLNERSFDGKQPGSLDRGPS